MMTSAESGAAWPLLLPHSADFGRHCRHCGRPLPENCWRGYCSTYCRRKYQDARRKRERRAERLRRGSILIFCPVCGVPMLTRRQGEAGKACSPCCRAIKTQREKLGLPAFEHPPNYDLGLLLVALPRDPWRAHDLTADEEETIWANALLEPIPVELFNRKQEANY